jgi:hypothetical protein
LQRVILSDGNFTSLSDGDVFVLFDFIGSVPGNCDRVILPDRECPIRGDPNRLIFFDVDSFASADLFRATLPIVIDSSPSTFSLRLPPMAIVSFLSTVSERLP